MTVGYLLDLLIINEVRKEKLVAQLDGDVKNDLNRQNGYLLREIGRYILEISENKRPAVFAKHKNYDKEVVEPETENLMEIIHRLYQRHTDLWELEDIRRDRSANDKIRLTAADQVSVVNKKRNDLVEMIDRIIRCDLIAVENNA
jgi:hypothetical protein